MTKAKSSFGKSHRRLGSRRGQYFTLVITEPLSHKTTVREIPLVPGRSLFSYLDGAQWKGISYATVQVGARRAVPLQRAVPLRESWALYVPSSGERVEIHPQSGMKSFTDAYIEKLNANTDGGIFVKALVLTETTSPLVKRYFVDHDKPIVFDGNTYYTLSMSWGDFEISKLMPLPDMSIIVPNLGLSMVIGGEEIQVVDYIYTKDVRRHDVELQFLHLDLLGDINAKDPLLLQVQFIECDDMVAVFHLGLNLGLTDTLPREVILRTEFPGIVSTMTRISV